MCVCMCVCVREREGGREGEKKHLEIFLKFSVSRSMITVNQNNIVTF